MKLTHSDFRGFYRKLNATMRSVGAPFPLFTGTRDPLHAHGVAYYPFATRKEHTPWFANTAYARGEAGADFSTWSVGYFIHWPDFLWQARAQAAGPWDGEDEAAAPFDEAAEPVVIYDLFSPEGLAAALQQSAAPTTAASAKPELAVPSAEIQPLARQLLYLLLPLIEQYDTILAQDLRTLRKRWTLELPGSRLRPRYMGHKTVAEERRFDAHLRVLLQDSDFRKYLERTMRQSFHAATAVREQETLGRCPSGRSHRVREGSCELCAGVRWSKWNTSLLRADVFDTDILRQALRFQLEAPEFFTLPANPWLRVLQDILCAQEDDGVASFSTGVGPVLLVDFGRLASLAEEQEREGSPLLLEALAGDGDPWMRGCQVRRAFETMFPQAVTAHKVPLQERVKAQGWTWMETLDLPYGQYRLSALVAVLENASATAKRMLRARAERRRRERFPRRVPLMKEVLLEYPRNGAAVPVRCIRRRRRNQDAPTFYYTVPYQIPEADLKRLRRDRAMAISAAGTLYWSLRGVNAHAEMRDRYGHYLNPAARDFVTWLLPLDAAMPQRYDELLYDGKYGERIRELQEGRRKRLSSYAAAEDRILEEFLAARQAKNLSAAEWEVLLEQLPGRSRESVRRRMEQRGREFAMVHGWKAYTQSKWCLQRSSVRRRRWTREGMPP